MWQLCVAMILQLQSGSNCTRHFNRFSNLDVVRPPYGAGTLCWTLRGTAPMRPLPHYVGEVVIVNLFGILCVYFYTIFGLYLHYSRRGRDS